MLNRILTALLLALLAASASADVYKYRDAEGHIHLTDRPMQGPYRLLKRFSLKGTRSQVPDDTLSAMHRRREQLAPLIEAAANRHRLQPALVHAVVRAESAFRSDAVSSKGAIGLMQLMPGTARQYGVTDPYDAEQNLQGGSRYLGRLLEMFDHDLRLALAAYNAGENAVLEYGRQVPPYAETQRYVQKVIEFFKEYSADERLAQR